VLANDAKEPLPPIDSTEPREQIERTESWDQRDHTFGRASVAIIVDVAVLPGSCRSVVSGTRVSVVSS
jgi:hypothetical protein